MKVDITDKRENSILQRQEITFTVKEAGTTPSRKELREKIAALLGADEKSLVVDVLKTGYGTTQVSGKARVYKSEKELRRLETKPMVERNLGRPEKKKAEEEMPAAKPAKK
ncbi:MAG TPA: 30S ribosomal protein S24e [archaeon]|nr:30S ribosomal protein S24e [archaeon]